MARKWNPINWLFCALKVNHFYPRQAVERGQKTVLDAYGATNPAEFFAVATETFFEKPRQLKKNHSGLYAQLQHYYRVDPIQWISNPPNG
ncbi:hypothetical protein GS597_13405 [Synechococcales cyanobacterium C]|uniref:Uncharacterized protein n=1 Tax=Petrachloros mirabilis ULC683 TaxID=2781853 RepID=A0A8K2A0H5_9CYAN|nr:zinc-dependent peptidase [Petrachloros mirabilis]NCJ07486.1 hypothetical protein [Petrachloros mirabilis ULC683]